MSVIFITHDWLHEYTCAVAFPRIRTKGLDSALRALKRWPRLQPYWRRLRRRVCDHCASQVALSEPRYLVCGGCGVARYCSEECQCADWDSHQHICASMARRRRRRPSCRRWASGSSSTRGLRAARTRASVRRPSFCTIPASTPAATWTSAAAVGSAIGAVASGGSFEFVRLF